MSSIAVRIRRAAGGDLDALVETRVALFLELGRGGDDTRLGAFRSACREVLSRTLSDGAAVAWLATSSGEDVLGSIVLLLHPRLPSPLDLGAREGYLLNVFVVPAERRRGIASALVAGAVAEARALGLARVRLHATESGRAVYARHGFLGRVDEMELALPTPPTPPAHAAPRHDRLIPTEES